MARKQGRKGNYNKHTQGQAMEQQNLVHSKLSKPNEEKKYVRGVSGKVFELPQLIPLNRPTCLFDELQQMWDEICG